MFITPPFLNDGSRIGIVSTARKISQEELNPALLLINNAGFVPVLGPHLFAEHNQFAGNDTLRLSDFQSFLDDDSIEAILCARGGYGTVRLIDSINFSHFTKKPKWIIGYSDVCVLHAHINRNFSIETLHATMPLNMNPENVMRKKSTEAMFAVIRGEKPSYRIQSHPLNRFGHSEAEIVGGNLSILYSLLGSNSQIDTKGKILFIEDLDEYLYHIDRMMMALERAGMLNNLAGLIVGGMSDMKDNAIPYGKSAEEIISERVEKFSFPVCFEFPAGHIQLNLPIILGRKISLQVLQKESIIQF